MTPGDTVDAFVRLTTKCLDTLITHYEGTERPTAWAGMRLRPRDGERLVRSGSLGDLGTFHVHGMGCLFELHSGADVDVNWDSDGRAVFDSWRVLMYARSLGDDLNDQEALRAAASKAEGVLQIGPDSFTLTHRRYDVVRSTTS